MNHGPNTVCAAGYQEARSLFEREVLADVEQQARKFREARRKQLQKEIAALTASFEADRTAAEVALAEYVRRYPPHDGTSSITRPSLWDALRTLGAADACYRRVLETARKAASSQSARRRKMEEEGDINAAFARGLALQLESARKRFASEENEMSLHRRYFAGCSMLPLRPPVKSAIITVIAQLDRRSSGTPAERRVTLLTIGDSNPSSA